MLFSSQEEQLDKLNTASKDWQIPSAPVEHANDRSEEHTSELQSR